MIRTYFLHVADDKKDGKVDPNDHVNEIILPSVGKVAEEEEHKGGEEGSEDVARGPLTFVW